MASFSATDVAFTGFRFVREHPRTVAVWLVVQLFFGLLSVCAMIQTAGPALTQMMALSATGSTDPAAGAAMFRAILPMYGVIGIVSLVYYPILYATMSRAVLRPGENAAGYIRLGGDEVRQLLLILLWLVVWVGAEIAVVIVLVVLGIALRGASAIAGLAMLVLGLNAACGAIYCGIRLSLASPLTFDTRRVDLFGSWRLTRGHFWKLLGTYLLVMILGMIVYLCVMVISAVVAVILGGGLSGASAIFRPDFSSIVAYFTPVRIIYGFLSCLATTLVLPVWFMPPAEIYRQLALTDEVTPTPSRDAP